MRRFFAPFLFALAACGLSAQSSEAVLANHLKALGGQEKVKAIKALRLVGTLEAAPGVILPLVVEEARPNRMRMEVKNGEQSFLRVFDGVKGFQTDSSTGVLVPFSPSEIQTAQADTFDGDLIEPASRGARVEALGRQMIQGHDCYRLKVTEKDGSVSTHWVDGDHFLEIQSEKDVNTPRGRMTRSQQFSDFRLVEGVPIPFRVVAGQKYSTKTQMMQFKEVFVNPTLPDSEFKPPTAP